MYEDRGESGGWYTLDSSEAIYYISLPPSYCRNKPFLSIEFYLDKRNKVTTLHSSFRPVIIERKLFPWDHEALFSCPRSMVVLHILLGKFRRKNLSLKTEPGKLQERHTSAIFVQL